ncbi:hypothetical protein, partial [Serratia marcescens]|uniref:hypothetical protein n=1 Tax=Serratia marcescens TaxID=615 RepID=UPI0013DA117A
MKKSNALLLSSTCFAVLLATPAMAQDTVPETGRDSTANAGDEGSLVVTGTRIVRLNNRSAAPIITPTAAEIAAQGATTIEE